MGSSYPYVVRVEMDESSQRVIAEIATPLIAVAVLRQAVMEYPSARVILYINGHAAIEGGPAVSALLS
jgi:hypothetical protein